MKSASILRTAYWAGAISDFIFGLLMIFVPSVCLKIYGINIELSPAVRFWMAYAGIAIFSWTGFLIWGLGQLKERKFIALATVFIIFGFVSVQIAGVIVGTVSIVNMVLLFALQLILAALLLVGYCKV